MLPAAWITWYISRPEPPADVRMRFSDSTPYRKSLTTVGTLLACLLLACTEAPAPPVAREAVQLPPAAGHNVLLITFDAFRADNLAAYGGREALTPRLDHFATESIVFANAYVAGQATPSSFAAGFTGSYPFRVFRAWRLVDTQTLARVFAANGYRTGAVLNNMQLVASRNFQQGFETYSVFRDQSDERPIEEFTEFLSVADERPFFAWVHLINPHSPYELREGSEHHYDPDYRGEYEKSSGARVQTYKPGEMPSADVERIKSLYRGEVEFADRQFGKLIDLLHAEGLDGNTVIVVSADHGEAMDEHGVFGHHQLYEEIIRVPMLLRHPGAPPQVIDARVSNIDLLPTLTRLAGLDFVAGVVDGEDWSQGVDPGRALLSTQMTNKAKLSMALREGDFKFISWCTEKEGFREELFDMAADPLETQNLAEVRDYADHMIRLYDRLVAEAGGEPCGVIAEAIEGGDIMDVDEETLEALRSLGYIQ